MVRGCGESIREAWHEKTGFVFFLHAGTTAGQQGRPGTAEEESFILNLRPEKWRSQKEDRPWKKRQESQEEPCGNIWKRVTEIAWERDAEESYRIVKKNGKLGAVGVRPGFPE